ncbi:DUF4124 domain-containing protein [Luteimonas sp. BDR2-5]|uniref:DUF4124 domain-containing protein n=1 Tax=Proluteimonas luteida TaxID=2878685 RepID=UPI001E4DE215|nr:DUF4124 domain-containing protein [Luteimonas sp. BDR2-5]MCD9027343.1 DUF4124 domain-containing protein [Luteimonas sp. BDR2-5]
MRTCLTTLPLLFALATATAGAVPAAGNVTVYRCTDGGGRVALQDTPCAEGQSQRERSMLRPVDGPPPAPRPEPPPPPPAAPQPQVVVLQAPQPMYRCVRPDGSSYTSDSDAGNPRWVPLWTLGYGPPRRRPPVGAPGGSGIEPAPPPGHRPPPHRGAIGPAGTWVRDNCQPLPQREVCGLLVDRREEIRRRFFNAQPTERDQLRREERNINARLDNDCRQ